jgi:hypothetical protein
MFASITPQCSVTAAWRFENCRLPTSRYDKDCEIMRTEDFTVFKSWRITDYSAVQLPLTSPTLSENERVGRIVAGWGQCVKEILRLLKLLRVTLSRVE